MEYFVIMPDEEISSYKKLDYSNPDFQGSEPFVAYSDFDKSDEFPDYFFGRDLFTYSFCVSDAMKEILTAYTVGMDCIPFFLTDRKHRDQRVYWLIRPELFDCFAPTLYPDVNSLVWEEIPAERPFLFQTTQGKARYLIVALELAENLLRRQMFGIRYIRIGGGDIDEQRN